MAITYNETGVNYDDARYTYDGSAVSSISINGIHGHTFSSGTEELIVVWDTHPIIKGTSGWETQAVNLTTDTSVHFDSFLDGVFMVNYVNSNYFYNGTTWSTTTNVTDSPIAQYVKEHQSRIYLYKIKIGALATKTSWVWFSDLPKNNQLTWGIESGTDLAQTASSGVITSAGSLFKTRNIKINDPVVILTGGNAGEYTVQSVDSETQLTLSTALAGNATNSQFFAGGNYFSVADNDGDIGMGLAETSNELFCFKTNSLYRWNVNSQLLRKVKTAPGTTSARSIVESGGYVYWYHPSGIYRTQGDSEQLISNAIEDVINGVASADRTSVCGWRDDIKKTVSWFLGNVTLRDGRIIEKCRVMFDENGQTWSVGTMNSIIKVATNWLESSVPKVYAGDPIRSVFQLETGNDFNGSPIPFEVELKPVFPNGTEQVVTFTKLHSYIEQGSNVRILYKLMYKPGKRNETWVNDTDWKPLKGVQNGEKAEWLFPNDARASGVKLKIVESSTKESFLIEKLILFYRNPLEE